MLIRRTRYSAFVLFALGLSGYTSAAQFGTTTYVDGTIAPGPNPIFVDENSSLSGEPPLAYSGLNGPVVRYNGQDFPPPAVGTTDKVLSIYGFNCGTLFYLTVNNNGFATARTAKFTGSGFGDPQALRQNSSFGASAGDPIATLDYVNTSGIYQGALYSSVTNSFTNVNTNSLGVFAGPISSTFVSSFHGFFSVGGGTYSYQDELHFGLTDLNPTPITLASGYTSAELTSINGASAVGTVGIVASDFTYMAEEPAFWALDLNGHKVGSALLLPNLGTAGTANAINATGAIVGTLNGKAFLWTKDATGTYQALDLNTLIPANSGWVLDFGETILDDGSILGTGTFNGQPAVFELTPTPVPEPATLALLGLTLLPLTLRRPGYHGRNPPPPLRHANIHKKQISYHLSLRLK